MSKAGREQEVREMITKVSALTSRNVELEGSNTSLQKRMAELQKEMDELAAHMRAQMAAKDAEVKNKDDQMDAMTKDYKVRRSYEVKLWSFSNNFVSRFSIFVLIIYKLSSLFLRPPLFKKHFFLVFSLVCVLLFKRIENVKTAKTFTALAGSTGCLIKTTYFSMYKTIS